MNEAISALDVNYSNAGGGHTASVSTVVGAKLPDGTAPLGGVGGKLGETNTFTDPDLNKLMDSFVCSEITTTRDPIKTIKSRSYIDRTSMLLESYMVLVRGVNCGPEADSKSLDYEGVVPHFGEVLGSPVQPFRSLGPTKHKSVIAIGRVYNFESAAKFDGVKISLFYHNKELQPALSLNDEFVSPLYKGIKTDEGGYIGGPDLAQYNIRCGYTMSDFVEMMSMVGVPISFDGEQGMPNANDVLFDSSGTLSSVVSTIASYFGYYWFVDPTSGSVRMINSVTASKIDIKDEGKNPDSSEIVSSSFTESLRQQKIVNVYTGTLERGATGGGGPSNETDARPRPVFFKRVYWHESPHLRHHLPKKELSIYFGIFNQQEGTEIFDKFTYIMTHMNRKDENGKYPISKLTGRKLDYGILWDHVPFNNQQFWFRLEDAEALGGRAAGQRWIFGSDAKAEKFEKNAPTDLQGLDRIDNKFAYKLLKCKKQDPKTGEFFGPRYTMPKPHGTRLYEYLEAYFAIAGGVYISNSYSRYKAQRMDFQNANDINVLGPYHKDWLIRDIDDLSVINDYLGIIADIKDNHRAVEGLRVENVAESTNGEAKNTNEWYFFAIRNIPKLEKKNQGGPNPNGNDARVDFSFLSQVVEMFEPDKQGRQLFIGGPTKIGKFRNDLSWMMDKWENRARQSVNAYHDAVDNKKVIELRYIRSKTRVNKLSDDGEEAEDNALSDSSGDSQKMSDLFDKLDYKYFAVDCPEHKLTNMLTLSSANGSAVEMKGLRDIRGSFTEEQNEQVMKNSSKQIYGLDIPKFTPEMNNLSFSVNGGGGVTTSVGKSSLLMLPPDQGLLVNRAMEAHTPKSNIPIGFRASQRNFFGL